MGSPSAPKAPKAPPAPTQTRRQAQFALDQQLREDNAAQQNQSPLQQAFAGRSPFGTSSLLGSFVSDPQERLDARPESDFLPAVEDRDFQSLDAQIRGRANDDQQTVRNRELQQSLLQLLGEDVDSPTIL